MYFWLGIRKMNHSRLLALLLVGAPCSGASDTPPWPHAEKQAAIAGCRLSITTHAEQDYLKRHNLKELPSWFHERTAGAMEPYLAICNCAFNYLEKQWSFEYFMSHQGELPPLLNQIATGPCALVPPTQQGVKPDNTAPSESTG